MLKTKESWISWSIVFLFFLFLYFISLGEYLVFHWVTELFTIVIASTVFVITLNTRKYFSNQYMVFIGISYLFIAILDLFHTLTYTGMPIYVHLNYPANQLWIAARYYESIMLLMGFSIMYGRKVHFKRLLLINSIITAIILASVLWFEVFPECYIEGQGLTPFKVYSEYIISIILVVTLVFIRKKKNDFTSRQYLYLSLALFSTIVSELLFTFYISNYGISNLFGHYFKVLSFVFIYLLIIKEGLQEPYSMIFKELEDSRTQLQALASLDPLTKLLNRRSLMESFDKLWKQARRDQKEVSVMLIDIDDFKVFNDQYGHSFGDEILIKLSNVLNSITSRPLDLVSRHGGEEFVIVFYDCSNSGAIHKANEIHKKVELLSKSIRCENELTVSIGFVTTDWVEDISLNRIIHAADEQMYIAKNSGKNTTKGILYNPLVYFM